MRFFCMAALIAPPFITVACASSQRNSEIETTVVRIVEDSVPLQQTATLTTFHVTAVIRNDGARQVRFGGCGPSAERSVNGQWQTVSTPMCLTPVDATLAPGDSVTVALTIPDGTGPIQPQPPGQIAAGIYRLTFGVWYPESPGATVPNQLEALTSPPFKVY